MKKKTLLIKYFNLHMPFLKFFFFLVSSCTDFIIDHEDLCDCERFHTLKTNQTQPMIIIVFCF